MKNFNDRIYELKEGMIIHSQYRVYVILKTSKDGIIAYDLTTVKELSNKEEEIDKRKSKIIKEYLVNLLEYKMSFPIKLLELTRIWDIVGFQYISSIDKVILESWITKSRLLNKEVDNVFKKC